ncbi:MAG: threonine--tRNA ligase [Halobacteria archaeon]
MQLLLVHADFLEFESQQKTKVAEATENRNGRFEEVLVAFTAVEKADEADESCVVGEGARAIREVASQVKAPRVLLYPYAHLSPSLASPGVAVRILRSLEAELAKSGEVHRAPFGWYKRFTLACKGHPLSELSRTIRPGEGGKGPKGAKGDSPRAAAVPPESLALAAEKRAKSSFLILAPGGRRSEVGRFDFQARPRLGELARYEMAKVRAAEQEPPHVELMQRLEWVDHEAGSDPGNLRFYPKGRLVKALLESYVSQRVAEYGALEVETPIMYDLHHPTLRSYLDRFPARQYAVSSESKELFLRFAACFGQFLMGHDMVLSYRHMPVKLFELTRYSFRREQSGELTGLRRLRAFTMPDMHTLCADMEQALQEFKSQILLCRDVLRGAGVEPADTEIAIRFTRDFYAKNSGYLDSLLKELGQPAFAEEWEERFFYFVCKAEFNFVDNSGKASALATVQIDVENAERYGIKFIGEDGKERLPVILHASPTGAVERILYALLEKAHRVARGGGVPNIPVWLAPTQVRLAPVSADFVGPAEKVARALAGLRVDLDDRDESVGRKVRDAGMDWVPYVAVIGEKEAKSGKLAVTVRSGPKGPVEMTAAELRERILKETAGLPTRPLPLPQKLSQRPKFR